MTGDILVITWVALLYYLDCNKLFGGSYGTHCQAQIKTTNVHLALNLKRPPVSDASVSLVPSER